MDALTCPVDSTPSDRHCRLWAMLLIAGAALLHLAYLACNCPLDLSPDEGHYWDWSRHLDWSYYSKGPGVAWLIRLSCELFGGLSTWLTGNEMLAVRLPAVLCGSLLLASMYVLTVQVSGRRRLGLLVVAAALTTPAITAGTSLMTIDSPYTCCWGWALVLAYRAVFQRSAWAWWLAGLTVGPGILFKYTMAVWLPSLALFLLVSREHRALLWSRGFWIMSAIASLASVPILIWNAQHDWVSFLHVFSLAGLRQKEPHVNWLGPLQFVAIQCALWLVFWFIVWVRAMVANAPWKVTSAPRQFLWWMSAPIFGIFLAFSLKTGSGEPNWPVTAYISGLVLGMLWLADILPQSVGWERRLAVGGLVGSTVVGILLVLVVHFSAWIHPLLMPLVGPATAAQPYPVRRIDPTFRLRGWRALAAEIDRLRDKLREENVEPVLAGTGWNMPGLLGFYCADHPVVYSLGPIFADRCSQYDLWRPNPILDAEEFKGRTFIVASSLPIDLSMGFENIETHRVVLHMETGQPMAEWVILICRGYRGFGTHCDWQSQHF